MRRRKLLILGCGGFVGSHLVDRVLGSRDEAIEGWDVTFHKIARHAGNARLSLHQKYIDGDTTISELEPAIEDVDAVFSLAAICTPAEYVASPASNHTLQLRRCAPAGRSLRQVSQMVDPHLNLRSLRPDDLQLCPRRGLYKSRSV